MSRRCCVWLVRCTVNVLHRCINTGMHVGIGTSGDPLGLAFQCAFRVAYVWLETGDITKTCNCNVYVAFPEYNENVFRIDGCSCVDPFVATAPQSDVPNVMLADTVQPW